ncbi:hypothetical protein BC827DRAFT_1202489 [Russula dissimulans]|nr:hypothetical protein BC827DRAFT_1202489 [Russula dissimulans]
MRKSLAYWIIFPNRLGQNPCKVAAYLASPGNGGVYTVNNTNSTPGYHGPEAGIPCLCTIVGYSLFTACAGCQNTTWVRWSGWEISCAQDLLGHMRNRYQLKIPSCPRVPHWAYLDVKMFRFFISASPCPKRLKPLALAIILSLPFYVLIISLVFPCHLSFQMCPLYCWDYTIFLVYVWDNLHTFDVVCGPKRKCMYHMSTLR